ncbi:MAG: hypothetical protein IPK82_15780 [Polyangiaceae bacterium]|nr:hypothetical protein [Polyangiaceae bacterium]
MFARADGFVEPNAFGTLRERLLADGHHVTQVEVTLSELKSESAFLTAIEQAANTSNADIVVMTRAWSGDLIHAVRKGLPKAIVVRLTQGVRAALDSEFDYVLDPSGVLALASGATEVKASEYERVSAADLRRKLALSPTENNVSLEGARPTLKGPVSGCPFLLDARKNEVFVSLNLNPEAIQTKGCTFCLDNSGAYTTVAPELFVETWLRGLRHIRKERPSAREVLLVDERPHPYLPALFEAIEKEPALHKMDLLWKSRVDWLLEYEDAIVRACESAARSSSIVHLYLVGFENFDRWHLDLFNKGHGPELNEAAILKMRELSERFPTSFEYRRYRSHGIVLFTPWTSPDALIENARWMRRVAFHELRTEALKTRLRLYPRVPLYALAEKDGLLADEFAAERGDRAAEQGYDASTPWRFRDPKTEAIFALANQLHTVDRALTDADVIETAARFVARWPGLANEPALAHLPVRAAIEAWGSPLGFIVREVGPAAAAFDPEIEAIGKTKKRASLKETVRNTDAREMARAYRAMGFAADVVLTHAMEKNTGVHNEGGDHAVIAVAENEAALAEVKRLQRALWSTRDREEQAQLVRQLGEWMGYPPCCTAAFSELSNRGNNLENERFPFRQHPLEPLHPWLHRTGSMRLVAHHVCSPSCAASVEEANRVVDLLRAIDPVAAERLTAQMCTPSLFLDYERFASLTGAWEKDEFVVSGVAAVGRCRAFEQEVAQAHRVKIAPDHITLVGPGGAVRNVGARAPLLLEPGKAVAAQVREALLLERGVHTSVPPKSARASIANVLPSAIRPGVRAGTFVIAAVEHTSEGHRITFARGDRRILCTVKPWKSGVSYTVRKGRWALDVADAASLDESAKAAIVALVRALPA